jgi:hypothetical protein
MYSEGLLASFVVSGGLSATGSAESGLEGVGLSNGGLDAIHFVPDIPLAVGEKAWHDTSVLYLIA